MKPNSIIQPLMHAADVCVYGGTSAGVIAAVASARRGHRVILIEPGRHLGGMTSGGLGATDFGNKSVIGGLARDFYRRVGAHYGVPESWVFEPSVTKRIFEQLVDTHRVKVLREHRLVMVNRVGDVIRSLRIEHRPTDQHNAQQAGDGTPTEVSARQFIDCSYEGDLMARAGVDYHVGREASSVYGESLNGVCPILTGHQFNIDLDPYRIEGDPTSGLLPMIDAGDADAANDGIESPGAGDRRVQAYNFRLCFTRKDANRLEHVPPPGYDPDRYALLARYLRKLDASGVTMRLHRLVMAVSPMPGQKTDINNSGPFSTDCIGMNWQYPDADYALRGEIFREHLRYTQGLVYFLATSANVPSLMRAEMSLLGRCRDEFVDTEGWPHQLYVREARRMIGMEVVTQGHCEKTIVTHEPIGMAAYKMDSHNVRRVVIDGCVRNEGNIEVPPTGPYAIPYGAITPKTCSNLLVPVCLSASHIAYGSIRMEPVFMVLAESAAIAADLAMRDGVAVQSIDRVDLRDALVRADQVLEHDVSDAGPMNEVFVERQAGGVASV